MSRIPPIAAALLTAALLATPVAQAQDKAPTATGRGGAAATVDTLGTQAAIDALRDGGNAVDAAVAAAAVLGVTEPYSSGIGGGGFMVIRTPDGKVTTIDSREKAPRAMVPTSFVENGEPLPFSAARYSGLSAGVPGTPLGWARALRLYGTWDLERALESGIRVAREGFEVDQTFVDQTTSNVPFFDDIPATARIYLDEDGTPRDVGTTLRNPDMAKTYERMARLGVRRGFYRGPVAGAIARAVQSPPTGPGADKTWRPGLMTRVDLAKYTAPERRPTRVGFRGLDVWGMAPPSSGGSTIGEALNILEGYIPSPTDRPVTLHRMIEAMRLAFADRNAFIGDPSFIDVPLRGILSQSFGAERRILVPWRAANRSVLPGNPFDDNEAQEAAVATAQHPSQSTTHLTVADDDGMVVSYTFTIESTGGNGIVVPGWGFLLNNELTDFNYSSSTHPNRVNGGKRPRSSMAPTIVTRNGVPDLAVGTPGGATIITTVLQLLVEHYELERTLPQAIAAPRVSQLNSATSNAEPEFRQSGDGQELVSRYGHAYSTASEIGAATGIDFLRDGRMRAAAEPTRRGGGSAMVVRPDGG